MAPLLGTIERTWISWDTNWERITCWSGVGCTRQCSWDTKQNFARLVAWLHWFVSYLLVYSDEKGFCWLQIWKPHPIRYTKNMECNGSSYDFSKAWVVGVIKFSTKKLGDLLEIACISLVVNQVERHPSWEERNCILSRRMWRRVSWSSLLWQGEWKKILSQVQQYGKEDSGILPLDHITIRTRTKLPHWEAFVRNLRQILLAGLLVAMIFFFFMSQSSVQAPEAICHKHTQAR